MRWASVTGFRVVIRYPTDAAMRPQLRRIDLLVVGFSFLQLVLVPFVRKDDLLVGHIVVVVVVSTGTIFVRFRG